MPITTIKELRILPPMAIARFGSSPEPLENYALEVDDPLGWRKIRPAPTFIVDSDMGAIAEVTNPAPNAEVKFRDDQGRVKPLAPFLEVWARFEDDSPLEQLTVNHLAELKLTPANITWNVKVANLKPNRRTGNEGDRVDAETGPFNDHFLHELHGKSPNFKPEKSIYFGSIRYIRPTEEFPEIRARFTPAAGKVFGTRKDDSLINDDVYDGYTADFDPKTKHKGRWDRYYIDNPGANPVTSPGDIFQGKYIGSSGDLDEQTKLSDGYLDDTCDGIIEASLVINGQTLTAYARIVSTLPDFAPDSFIVRTIADDLEQITLGPYIAQPTSDEEKQKLKREVEDVLRRAFETVRLMNTMVQNGDQNVGGVKRNYNNMAGQETGYGRTFEPIYPEGGADYNLVVALHQGVLQQALSSTTLEGSFDQLSKIRPYDEIGDLTDSGRRRMPAMMRGNEGLELTLTRRQYRKLELASSIPLLTPLAVSYHLKAELARTVPPDNFVRIQLPFRKSIRILKGGK